ncbi:MAG: hypothetical protein K2N31_09785 [Treponemataceae bacterium]|nr:hypothetical protein [Treponemataceae bacterium]
MKPFTDKESAVVPRKSRTADRIRVARWLSAHGIVLEQSFAGRLRAFAVSYKKTAAS